MDIISTDNISFPDIQKQLQSGGVFVYPTETCYGLGCDATNPEAVDRVFKIKQRQKDKTVLVIMPSIDVARTYVYWTPKMQELADSFWPGPLTIVAQVRTGISFPEGIIKDNGTIAFRVTSHPIAKQMAELLDGPLVSTSANISTQESPYDIDTVLKNFSDQEYIPDTIIDGGILTHKQPSTIVHVLPNDDISIIRQGAIFVE